MLEKFYIFSFIYFIIGIVLGTVMLMNPQMYYLRYYHTHLILIGFVAQVIIATMLKQITVLTGRDLFKKKLEPFTFYTFNIGLPLFFINKFLGAIFLAASFISYALNIVATIFKSKIRPGIVYYYLFVSIFLTLGAGFGFMNYLFGGLKEIHMYLTIFGGVTFIIIGAMSFMLPMVLVREVFSKKLVNIVLVLFFISVILLVLFDNIFAKILIIFSSTLFLINMFGTYFKKDRKIKSVEARFFLTSLIYMILGIILLFIKTTAYIWHLFLVGFVIQTIIGAMYHIVPTTAYIEYMKKGIVIRHFRELFSEKLSTIIYILLNISLILFILGFIVGNQIKILGGILLFITLIAFSVEMLRILIGAKIRKSKSSGM